MAEAELVALFEKASKAADRAVSSDGVVFAAEEARCKDALKAMGAVEVSTALLMSTQADPGSASFPEFNALSGSSPGTLLENVCKRDMYVAEVPHCPYMVFHMLKRYQWMVLQVGKRLRKLTKHQSTLVSSSAQELLDAWKKVVADEAASKSGAPNGTPKGVSPKPQTPSRTPVIKTEVKEVKVYTSKSSRVETKKVVSSSKVESRPSLKVETKHVVSSPKVESKHVSASPKVESKPSPKVEPKNTRHVPLPAGKTTPDTPSSSSANSSANGFEPKIGKLPKAGGDATRDRYREHLLEGFIKCCKELTDEHLEAAKKVDLVKVAVAVECALFAKLGLSKDGEKAKYRSIMFNLKDDKNPDFRRRVLLGEIKPEGIISMTADDMASDARKKENVGIREKALFECERGFQNMASTDQFKCGKCGQRKATYYQLQTRSADEPMTAFVTCVNCGNRWKF